MIARASRSSFLPTLRDAPADAEAVSHKLLVRGGFIRQVERRALDVPAARLARAPEGRADHPRGDGRDRRAGDVRAGADAGRALEQDRPLRDPGALQAPGPHGRDFVLPLTHEETFTFHARELQSYRQLPQSWYHFQTKDRDEPRPRGGLLRVREFIMKDSYSFDRDEDGLDVSFQAHEGAYERIFERCGLEAYGVEAESGMMGGRESLDFLAPSGLGREHARHLRERRLRGRPRDRARRPARAASSRSGSTRPRRSRRRTRDVRGARGAARDRPRGDVEGDAGREGRRDARARARSAATTGSRRRSCRRRSAPTSAPRPTRRSARASAPRAARSGRSASTGGSSPTRRCARASSSPARTAPAGTCAASRRAATIRPSSPTSASRRRATRARAAAAGSASRPRSRSATSSSSARATPSALGATFLDEDGAEKPIVMGSYGIGPGPRPRGGGRAAPRRAGRDRLAGRDRAVRRPRGRAGLGHPELVAIGEQVAESLSAEGLDVLLDDRERRPGEKFADADLIGCPLRVTVGKKTLEDGAVDVRGPRERRGTRVASLELAKRVVAR